ncbi:N-acetyltransferase [Sulfodiicoccus acidiphilus]|uniref:N-acetyltransferase n=1 Tax=Sulfodiicoccus acidiphilus TaxID=1670455 RepID=A0A348B3W1_9CREN|nr:N-acetyltransferase [Sulfodiicoccus acidiphilus]GGT88402.1 N-acetyltransferase [Sulfodiicoccus acidiphilus]
MAVTVREAKKEDAERIIELMVRLKKLNEEFDPLYTVRQDIYDVVKKFVEASMGKENVAMIVAEDQEVIGFVRLEIRSRMFYEPTMEGVITDLYVLPPYRRKGVGKVLIDAAIKELKSRGVYLASAEFPPMNKISVDFYQRRGFKPLLYTFFKEV